MVQLVLWINPYRKEIKFKGKKYRLREEYEKKIVLLNNIRIAFTVVLLLLAYFAGVYENTSNLVFWEIIISVQLVSLGIFYIVLPNEIEKMI